MSKASGDETLQLLSSAAEQSILGDLVGVRRQLHADVLEIGDALKN